MNPIETARGFLGQLSALAQLPNAIIQSKRQPNYLPKEGFVFQPQMGPNYQTRREWWKTGTEPSPSPSPAVLSNNSSSNPLINSLGGFNKERGLPPQNIQDTIVNSSMKYGVDPNILAGVLYQESGIKPLGPENDNINYDDYGNELSRDRGIAQINNRAYPNIDTDSVYDTSFAIDHAAKILRDNIKAFNGDIKKAILAYNLGVRGVQENRPDVNDYINGVLANLDPEYRRQLGL